MKQAPATRYICDYCGMTFSNREDCQAHERQHVAQEERTRNCSYCNGKGYVTRGYEVSRFVDSEWGDGHWVSSTRHRDCPCPVCRPNAYNNPFY